MRHFLVCACIALIAAGQAFAQQPVTKAPAEFGNAPADTSTPEGMFQAKIKAEWEAIKTKDKKAYGELLAEDYQGVEVDGQGERTKAEALYELGQSNISSYSLWGFKLVPLGPDAAFAIYEVTMQFPPKSVLRFSRVYVTELWVKRAGEWKILHYQETHVK
jgi:hypothetical protein